MEREKTMGLLEVLLALGLHVSWLLKQNAATGLVSWRRKMFECIFVNFKGSNKQIKVLQWIELKSIYIELISVIDKKLHCMNVHVLPPHIKKTCPWLQLSSLVIYVIIEVESNKVIEIWSHAPVVGNSLLRDVFSHRGFLSLIFLRSWNIILVFSVHITWVKN